MSLTLWRTGLALGSLAPLIRHAWDRIQTVLEIVVEGPDVCSSVFALLILLFIGERVIAVEPRLRLWTHRAALTVFFLYVGCKVWLVRPTDGVEVVGVLLRGLLAASWCLAISLISLPVGLWSWRHSVGALVQSVLKRIGKARRARTDRRQRIADAERRRQLQAEDERLAPDRERQQQEAEQRSRAEAAQRIADQRRREGVRLDCQLLYDRNRSVLRDKLTAKQLRDYFERYLADGFTAEEVERRGQELKAMISAVVESVGRKKGQFDSLKSLREYYRGERDSIETSDFADEIKGSLLSDLAHEEERAIRAFRQI